MDITTPDLPLTEKQIGLYRDLFVSSHNGYDEQDRDGKWRRVKHKLTFDRLVLGLKGSATLAISGIDRYSRAKWVAIDIDSRDQAAIRAMRFALVEELRLKSAAIHIEDSGGKGYHLWMALSKSTPVVDLLPLVGLSKSLAKDNNVEIDRVFPLEYARIKAPLSVNQKTKVRTAFVGDDFSHVADQGAYLDVIAANKTDASKLILPTPPDEKKHTRVPECVRPLEHNDLTQKGKRHKLLYGLVYGWMCQGLSEGEILASSEKWYRLHYKVEGGTPLPEHLNDTKGLRGDFIHGKAKFDCRNYPDIYNCPGTHCQKFDRASIYVNANAVRPFNPMWGKLPPLSLHIYLRLRGIESVAKAANPPLFKTLPVFYATEATLCTGLCSPKTYRKAVDALIGQGYVRKLSKAVLNQSKFKSYRRKNGHLKYGQKPPNYFVIPKDPVVAG